MAVDKASRDVVVARSDAIYYYGQHGRGPPYTYEGEKKMISVFKDYVAIVAPPKSNAMPRSNPLRTFGIGAADDVFNTSSFTLLNTELRFVAHQEQLTSQVKAVISEWGDLFVFTLDGKIFRYHEKPFAQKLDILYQRNLYVLAINLAQKAGLDSSQQNIILRKFGDYLYSKQDYDTAMQQYLKAIDNTEPSQVIRKVCYG
jgi:tetratricopeptide (TPR) repeat protein